MHRLDRRLCRARVGQTFMAGGVEYQLEGVLGDGAVGLVRKAKNTTNGTTVAVKFLAPDPKYIAVEAFDDVEARFRREGTRGAGLDHENLVRIIAYEENEGGRCYAGRGPTNPFIVMEYVRGRTLESLIKKLRP